VRLGDSTWTEVRDAEPSVCLLPVGSTEQHGPHAPLSTDALVAESVAAEAGDASETETAVLPTVTVGVSEEHRRFDGTLYVSPSTFRAYVHDILSSAPSEAVVVVNGHGGNVDALDEVCSRFTRDSEGFATHWTWWEAVDHADTEMGHAGAVETSVLLYLAPELVGEPVEGVDSWGEYHETAPMAYDTDEFADDGVVGDATEATKGEGERMFSEAVESLCRLIERVGEEAG